ncbi:MAG: sensor domain-containing diguanylate cyclase [Synechococcaceae cyanobacterium]|nr:sensor domain-containing diguanylate cyclase [Synechococcaceae cyanobacterium]
MAYPDYPIPVDEEQRLRDLERYGIIGLASDQHFERIVNLAASIFHTPIAVISLVEANRQWFLSQQGLEVQETPRDRAFCAHAIAGDDLFVIPDALNDERFATNPLVLGDPHVRFYAGAPLRSSHGHNLGSFCVIDRQPRPTLDESQRCQLRWLGELVMRELELRRLAHLCPITGLPTRHAFLSIGQREFNRARQDHQDLSLLCFDLDNFNQINIRWGHHAGDALLQDLSRLSRGFLREQDYAGRIGDGQFGLLLVGMNSSDALVLAEQLRSAVGQMHGVHSRSEFQLHISGGLTALTPRDDSFLQLLSRADQALQLAKGNGRNQIACLFSEP